MQTIQDSVTYTQERAKQALDQGLTDMAFLRFSVDTFEDFTFSQTYPSLEGYEGPYQDLVEAFLASLPPQDKADAGLPELFFFIYGELQEEAGLQG